MNRLDHTHVGKLKSGDVLLTSVIGDLRRVVVAIEPANPIVNLYDVTLLAPDGSHEVMQKYGHSLVTIVLPEEI
jgi:hypothetical protein